MSDVNKSAATYRLPNWILAEIKAESKRTGHSNNLVVQFWLADHIKSMKKPAFSTHVFIDNSKVVVYDREADSLFPVTLEEDEEEVIHPVCDIEVTESCEHALFVSKIPKVKQWIRESKKEAKY